MEIRLLIMYVAQMYFDTMGIDTLKTQKAGKSYPKRGSFPATLYSINKHCPNNA